jgi:ABC-type transport system involved in multi-copper enzyme maturation permease subunit
VRGARSFALQGLFGVVLAIAMSLFWLVSASSPYNKPSAADFSRDAFMILIGVQAVLLPLIAPAMGAGVISLERERQTLDLLLMTPLPRRSILLGKLAASLVHQTMVFTGGAPVVAGVCLSMGGVSPAEIAFCYGFILLCGFCFGAVGVACSCLFRRTYIAVAVAYLIVMFCMVGSVLVDALISELAGHYADPPGFIALCPPYAVLSFMDTGMDTGLTDSVGLALGVNVEMWMLAAPAFLILSVLAVLVVLRALNRVRPT